MSNVIFSEFSQIYGHSTDVYIELKVKYGFVNHTVSVPINTLSYKISEIYGLIATAWASHAWSAPVPDLTIDHTSELTTLFGSTYVDFVSIEVFATEENPRSLELPVILGLSRQMLEETGSIKYTFPASPIYTPSLPYMGAWRLQTEIPTYENNKVLLTSCLSDASLVTIETEKITDISRDTVSNSNSYTVRALSVSVDNIPFINLTDFDIFLDFAKRGDVLLDLSFDLFGNGDTKANIASAYSGESEMTDEVRKWCSFTLCLIPESNLY